MAAPHDHRDERGRNRLGRCVVRALLSLSGGVAMSLAGAALASSASADDGDGARLGQLVSHAAAPVTQVVDRVTESTADSATKAVTAPLGRAASGVDDVVAPAARPLTQDVVRPVVDRVAAPAAEKVLAPVSEAVVAPAARTVVAPLVDEVVAPVARPVLEPVAKTVVGPVTSALAPALRPVVETGVARPAVGTAVPVLDAIEPVFSTVRPAVDPLEPVVGVARPVVDAIEPVVGVTRPVVDAVSPVLDAVDPIIGPPLGPVVEADERTAPDDQPAMPAPPGASLPRAPAASDTDPAHASAHQVAGEPEVYRITTEPLRAGSSEDQATGGSVPAFAPAPIPEGPASSSAPNGPAPPGGGAGAGSAGGIGGAGQDLGSILHVSSWRALAALRSADTFHRLPQDVVLDVAVAPD
jgi:hypothetical protein